MSFSAINFDKKVFFLTKPQKFYISIFLTCAILASTIFYANFVELKKYYYKQNKENTALIGDKIVESFNSYKEILLTISARIELSDINKDSQKISVLLKQFYLSNNQDRINFTDLRWQGIKSNFTVNRYGILETTLTLPKDTKTKLQILPGNMLIVETKDNINLKNDHQLYCLLGVVNAKKEYIGYLAILPNFEDWIKSIDQQLKKESLTFSIIDQKKGYYFLQIQI